MKRRTWFAHALAGPSSTAPSWFGIDDTGPVRLDRIADPAEPVDCGQRLLRLRPRIRAGRRPVVARRRGVEGALHEGAPGPPATAYRRDAGRHDQRDRPARHR